jgi:hypothetical protein
MLQVIVKPVQTFLYIYNNIVYVFVGGLIGMLMLHNFHKLFVLSEM